MWQNGEWVEGGGPTLPKPDQAFWTDLNGEAERFAETWQPAMYPDPRDHPAVLAHEAASNISQISLLNIKGHLGVELRDHEVNALLDAEDVLNDLAARIAGDSLPELLPPWQ